MTFHLMTGQIWLKHAKAYGKGFTNSLDLVFQWFADSGSVLVVISNV